MCIGTGMGAAAVFERGDSVDELCNARKTDNLFLSKDARQNQLLGTHFYLVIIIYIKKIE